MSDLELITSYLNGQLDPEQTARVRERLDQDRDFQELALPLVVVWEVPPDWKLHPRPADEAERMWDAFTKEVGFVYQRRAARARKLWMLAIALLAIGLSAIIYRDAIGDRYVALEKYRAVSDSGREMLLRDSAHVALKPGARLRSSRELVNPNAYGVLLAGAARFRVEHLYGKSGFPRGLIVQTSDAKVATGSGLFDVETRGDTTFVEVLDRKHDLARDWDLAGSLVAPEALVVASRIPTADQVILRSGERARVIHGQKPEVLQRSAFELSPASRATHVSPAPTVSPPTARTVPSATSSPRPPKPGPAASAVKSPAAATAAAAISFQDSAQYRLFTAHSAGDVVLHDSTRVHMEGGAQLQEPLVAKEGVPYPVELVGSARFVALREPGAVAVSDFAVATTTAYMLTKHADFAVSHRGDTVDVEVFPRAAARPAGPGGPDRVMMSGTESLVTMMAIEEGQRARSIAGKPAVLLPPRTPSDSARVEVRKP